MEVTAVSCVMFGNPNPNKDNIPLFYCLSELPIYDSLWFSASIGRLWRMTTGSASFCKLLLKKGAPVLLHQHLFHTLSPTVTPSYLSQPASSSPSMHLRSFSPQMPTFHWDQLSFPASALSLAPSPSFSLQSLCKGLQVAFAGWVSNQGKLGKSSLQWNKWEQIDPLSLLFLRHHVEVQAKALKAELGFLKG